MSRLSYKLAFNNNEKNEYAKNNVKVIDTGIISDENANYNSEYINEDDDNFNKRYTNARFIDVQPHNLTNLSDAVNDKINITDDPDNDREGVWIYYNGKVFSLLDPPDKKWAVTHANLLHAVTTDKKLYDKLLTFRFESYLFPSEKTEKPTAALAFGHICAGNVAIIDLNAVSQKVNTSIVKEALKQAGYTKIYVGDLVGDPDEPEYRQLLNLKRIAKLKRLMLKF